MEIITPTFRQIVELIDEINKLENEEDKDLLVVAFFTQTSIEDLFKLSLIDYELLKEKCKLQDILSPVDFSNTIEHNGNVYTFNINPNHMNVAQWLDITTMERIENYTERVLKTACILCEKNGITEYNGSERLGYIQEIEELPASLVFGVGCFFLQTLKTIKDATELYTQEIAQLKEEQNTV